MVLRGVLFLLPAAGCHPERAALAASRRDYVFFVCSRHRVCVYTNA